MQHVEIFLGQGPYAQWSVSNKDSCQPDRCLGPLIQKLDAKDSRQSQQKEAPTLALLS